MHLPFQSTPVSPPDARRCRRLPSYLCTHLLSAFLPPLLVRLSAHCFSGRLTFFTLFPVPQPQGFLLPIPGAVIYPAHSCKLHLLKAKLPFHALHPYLKNKNPETLFMVCRLGFSSLMFGGSEPFSQSL